MAFFHYLFNVHGCSSCECQELSELKKAQLSEVGCGVGKGWEGGGGGQSSQLRQQAKMKVKHKSV